MTVIDQRDQFTATFGGLEGADDEAARPRAHVLRAVVAGLVAVVVVAVGLVLASSAIGRPTSTRVAPASVVPALARPAVARDAIAGDGADGLGIDPATTRYLLTAPIGKVYAALDAAGRKVCLVTVPSGDLPTATCGAPTTALVLTIDRTDDGFGAVELSGPRAAGGPAVAPWHRAHVDGATLDVRG